MTDGGTDTAGVVAPPPLIYLSFLLLGLALDWLWPLPLLPDRWQYPLAAALGLLGFLPAMLAARRFRSADTPLPTWQPTRALVTHGIYRFTRNPIYLGLTLLFAAIAVALDSLWLLLLLLPLLAVVRFGVIAREERYLEARFGADYLDYKSRVRRWF